MRHIESNFKGYHDFNIYYQCWLPEQKTRLVLLIAHGFAEHSGRYGNVVNYFAPRGYTVYALDHRGLKAMSTMDSTISTMDEAGLVQRLNKTLPPALVPGLVAAYRDALQKRTGKSAPADILGQINTDRMVRIPTIRLVETQRDIGVPAYNYLFTYKSPGRGRAMGAMHGLDNPFLFGNLDAEFTGCSPAAENLMIIIQDSCAAFAHTGDPSCASIGQWPVYGKNRSTMIFDTDTRVENAPYEVERSAWDKYDSLATSL
jgi:carboxylesterase type B